ncbi:MAG: hypothetical protein FWD28_02035 [Treponema sp.]|nr:hypothetical protein [Treponema sp.]
MKWRTALLISFGFILATIVFVLIVSIATGYNSTSSSISWNEGFNEKWAGTYLSTPDADYVAGFKLGIDGTYAFRYGSNPRMSTSYTGRYNRNFKNGVSSSGLNYKITGISVVGFDENAKNIRLAVDWDNPCGRHTDYFTLYLEY